MAEDPSQSTIQGDWGAVQMPRGDGLDAIHAPALNSGFSIGVSSKAPHMDAAKAYLLFAARPDVTLKLNLINGGIDPVRLSVLASPEYREFAPHLSAAAQAAIQGSTPWPTIPQASNLLDILTSKIIFALDGRLSPRQALDEAQAEWMKALGK